MLATMKIFAGKILTRILAEILIDEDPCKWDPCRILAEYARNNKDICRWDPCQDPFRKSSQP
jgi:hypothetical protein